MIKIVNTFGAEKDKNILEIGAGKGPLTEILILNFNRVFAVEYDRNLYDYLVQKFKNSGDLEIINKDILDLEIERIPVELAIGNIPYYITTPIIFKLIESKNIKKFGLLMQKEVAERVTAKSGSKDYGVLTVMCNFYCNCKVAFDIKKSSFLPPPKVDSSFVLFQKKEVNPKKAEKLFELVRASFSMRRKTFYNNIKKHYGDLAERIVEKFNISKNIRAEEIELATYEMIAEFLIGF